jgi:hypothetical protein
LYYIDRHWKNGKIYQTRIDDWQIVFAKQQVGKIIRGEYWSENDPTMSLEDARFLLRYFAAEIQNAYGPMLRLIQEG